MLGKLVRQIDVDARRDEPLGALRRRLAIRAAQHRAVDLDALDAAVVERLLERAVADLLDALRRDPEIAQPDHRENRRDDVPDVDLRLSLHRAYLRTGGAPLR